MTVFWANYQPRWTKLLYRQQHRTFIPWLLAHAIMLISLPVAASTPEYFLDFESDAQIANFRANRVDWRTEGSQLFTHIAGAGICGGGAMRVRLNPTSPEDYYRTELKLHHARRQFRDGERTLFVSSIRFDNAHHFDDSLEVYMQWHALPDRHLGEAWRAAPLFLGTRNGEWVIESRWDRRQITPAHVSKGMRVEGKRVWRLGRAVKNVWVRWEFLVKWGIDRNASLMVWKNGSKVIDVSGPNKYKDRDGLYYKFGIYKPEWRVGRNRVAAERFAKSVLFDRVLISRHLNSTPSWYNACN